METRPTQPAHQVQVAVEDRSGSAGSAFHVEAVDLARHHFVGYVGSASGSTEDSDNNNSVLQAIGESAGDGDSSEYSANSAKIRAWEEEFGDEIASAQLDAGDSPTRTVQQVLMTNTATTSAAMDAGKETAAQAAAVEKVADKAAEAAKLMPPPPAPVPQQHSVMDAGASGSGPKDLPPPPFTSRGVDDHLITLGARQYFGDLLTTPITKDNVPDLAALEEKRQKMFEEAQELDRKRRELDAQVAQTKQIASDYKRLQRGKYVRDLANHQRLFASGSKAAAKAIENCSNYYNSTTLLDC